MTLPKRSQTIMLFCFVLFFKDYFLAFCLFIYISHSVERERDEDMTCNEGPLARIEHGSCGYVVRSLTI